MLPDPDLIHYACIAHGTTVLAEFNSRDAALGSIAAQCLLHTPPFHSHFTHTHRSTTYAFLIDPPTASVFFAIFDSTLHKSDAFAFLNSIRTAFAAFSTNDKNLEAHCFQGEFNPVFRQLLGSNLDRIEGLGSPSGQRLGPIRGRPKKMKNRLLLMMGGERSESDEDMGNGLIVRGGGKSRGLFSEELSSGQQHHRAKKVWKKQVWVILSLDFVICVILFAVWLWVCDGFKCID